MKFGMHVTLTLGALALVAASPAPAAAQEKRAGTAMVLDAFRQEAQMELGKAAYERYCSGCHGETGNGAGPAAEWLHPKPRDFTKGTFKFRSTPTGHRPTDADLYLTITRGVPGTSMPPWHLVPEGERWALVTYIKSFADGWDTAKAEPIVASVVPSDLRAPERVKAGRSVYQAIGCPACHGQTGGGDGGSAKGMVDDWKNPIEPANFHRGVMRGGRRAEDLYRSIMTGFSGTPMPGFYGVLKDEQVWDMVAYLRYVMKVGDDPEVTDVHPTCWVYGTCESESADASAATEAP